MEDLLLSDAPVRTAKRDLLGRQAFIQSLADVLLLPAGAQCRVVSLEGSWGEGKTSTIEMTLDVIGSRDADLRPFVVRINPWQLGSRDSLVRALLVELATIIRDEARLLNVAKFSSLADSLLKYSNALSVLKTEPTSWVFATVAQFFLRFAVVLAKQKMDLQSFKGRVSKSIAEAGRPIIVIVDDLDRLLPEEVTEVIRFVRAVGDFERTTYLLAFDHPKIVESLQQAGVPSAEHFLEKIVQLRTHLPPIRPQFLKRMLDKHLASSSLYGNRRIFMESEMRRYELYDFYISPLITNVRTLLRVLARIELTKKEIIREVEYWDLFALNVLAVVSPHIFELIRTNPTAFLSASLPYPVGKEEEKAVLADIPGQVDSILLKEPSRKSRYLKGLVYSLFPGLRANDHGKSKSWLEHNGRIASEKALLTILLSDLMENSIPLDLARLVATEATSRRDRIALVAKDDDSLDVLVSMIREEISLSREDLVEDSADLALAIVERWVEVTPAIKNSYREPLDRTRYILPFATELIATAADPRNILERIQQLDIDGFLIGQLLEEVISPGIDAAHQLSKVLSGNISNAVDDYALHVEGRMLSGDETGQEGLSILLFSLRRISPEKFADLVSRHIESQTARRTLLVNIANSIFSSSVGRIAKWPENILSQELTAKLKKEAKQILAAGTENKMLLTSARAIVEGGEIVVETGQSRR